MREREGEVVGRAEDKDSRLSDEEAKMVRSGAQPLPQEDRNIIQPRSMFGEWCGPFPAGLGCDHSPQESWLWQFAHTLTRSTLRCFWPCRFYIVPLRTTDGNK